MIVTSAPLIRLEIYTLSTLPQIPSLEKFYRRLFLQFKSCLLNSQRRYDYFFIPGIFDHGQCQLHLVDSVEQPTYPYHVWIT